MTGPYREAADAVPSDPMPLLPPPEPLWLLRKHDKADDAAFIASTWAESYHDDSREVRHLRFASYRDRMKLRIRRILDRPLVEVSVAVLPDDATHIVGYLVAEGSTLHYVYVRPARRGYGLCRDMLDRWMAGHAVSEASHDTKHGAKLIRALNLTYNPLAVEAP